MDQARRGTNPKLKVLLLLRGGPGANHEYFEPFDSFLPAAGVEYYYYDQLGSSYFDQPTDTSLWNTDRFVDEVEQVRVALGLDSTNFVVLDGRGEDHSRSNTRSRNGQHLKGMVISNMMSSIPAYNAYADSVLKPELDPKLLEQLARMEAEGRTEDPAYEELLTEPFYTKHLLRMPLADWPEPVVRSFAKLNRPLYVMMQGPGELGASGKLPTTGPSATRRASRRRRW